MLRQCSLSPSCDGPATLCALNKKDCRRLSCMASWNKASEELVAQSSVSVTVSNVTWGIASPTGKMLHRIVLFGGGLCPEQLPQWMTASKPSQQNAAAKGQTVTIPTLLKPLQTHNWSAATVVGSAKQGSDYSLTRKLANVILFKSDGPWWWELTEPFCSMGNA